MNNPCKNCVAPKRHPGCHDNCPDRAVYLVKDLEIKREYQREHLKGNWAYNVFNRRLSDRMARKDAKRGKNLKSWGE